MTEEKERIKKAMASAKTRSIDVFGFDDKGLMVGGRNFDNLQALKKDMEAEGLYSWPVGDDNEGFSMLFCLQPPPPDYKPPASDFTEIRDLSIPYTGTDYRYNGLDSGFVTCMLSILTLMSLTGLFLFQNSLTPLLEQLVSDPEQVLTKPGLILWAILSIIASGSVAANFCRINVYADGSKLTIRRKLRHLLFRQPPVEVLLADLNKIRTFEAIGCVFARFELKSGKRVQLTLQKQALGQLIYFIKAQVSI
jgi:hypothetical protein